MKKIYLFLCLLTSSYFTYAQIGSLDSSFGVNGIQTTAIKVNFGIEGSVKVLRPDDGGLLVVVNSSVGCGIAKYLPTGAIDSSFGDNGYSVPIRFGAGDATLQEDGKIVVMGSQANVAAVARYNSNGSIDKTFNNTGITTLDTYINGKTRFLYSVATHHNEIYIVGIDVTKVDRFTENRDIFMCHINPDGSYKTATADYSLDDYAKALAIIGDKIIIAGRIDRKLALFAYNLDFSIDKNFGINGVVTTAFGYISSASSVVVQGDKLVVVGNSDINVVVGRYNKDGSLDNSFSEDGKLSMFLNSSLSTGSESVAIQDNKILIAAETNTGPGSVFPYSAIVAIERLNNDGSPDNAFGKEGIINCNITGLNRPTIGLLDITDTNIFILGAAYANTDYKNQDYLVGNFNLDGLPNTSFGRDGWIQDYYPGSELYFTKTTTQKDGKILAIGYGFSRSSSGEDFLVVRYNSNGSLDKSFGQNGVVTTGFGVNYDRANTVYLQEDKIIVAGSSVSPSDYQGKGDYPGNNIKLSLVRYSSNGTVDSAFGVEGKVTTDFGSELSFNATAITVKGDKILVVGRNTIYTGTSSSFAIARYNLDGSPDQTFNNDGLQIVQFNDYTGASGYSIATPGEKIVVISTGVSSRLVIARLNLDGSLDDTFNKSGKLVTDFGTGTYINNSAFAIEGDKIKIVSEVTFGTKRGLIFSRFNIDGSIDNAFPPTGKITSNFPGEAFEHKIQIQDDGKVVVASSINNYNDNRVVLARYNSDNSPDSSFGENGIQTTTLFKDKIFRLADIALFNKRLYAAGSMKSTYESQGTVAAYKTEGAVAAFKLEEPVACSATGSILREYWANVTGTLISDIPVNATPSSTSQLNNFEAPTDVADNYAQRIRGYICAPTTGNYTFYISGDDESELWLSTSDNPADKRKIASIGGMQWTNPREWTKFESQKSVTIFLQANTKYYIEALNKEGAGGDNLAVGWITPGTADIALIPGGVLSPFTGTTNPPVVCTATGTILREYWANVTGTLISDIPVNATPSSTSQLNNFEAPTDIADNYAQRIRGYICAPATGNYTFYISGDDESELWLSTSDNPADKRKIASIGGMQWTNPREWTKFESQKSVTIFLQANTKYYIEALNKEGAGGDNLAVGWITPGTADIALIPGGVLSPFTGTTNPPVVCTATGTILREYWANVPGTLISDIPVNATPSPTSQLNNFEAPTDIADNYAQRIRGYICAPATGNYTFYISGDDESELWLSTSDNPADKRKIASVGGMQWTNPREWTKFESQKSVTIFLQANTKYYIEALNKEGAGGDNLAVGWITPGTSDIAVIPGGVLSPFTGTTNPPVVCTATGSILREFWANVPGTLISDIPVNATPSSTSQLNNFEAPTDIADNYAQRIRGYICAPATGNYTFYISGDDESELWLSTSDNPADKRKIASVGGMQWTNSREWTKFESQKSITIFLQANTKYYLEALNKEGAGGDNLAVGWITPGTSDIAIIPGGVLSPFIGPSSQSSNVTLPSPTIATTSLRKVADDVNSNQLSLTALPNPTSTRFTIKVKSRKSEPVDLKVVDAVGRLIETKRKVSANGSVTFGDRYQSGVYYLQAVQGSERATLKLIKGGF